MLNTQNDTAKRPQWMKPFTWLGANAFILLLLAAFLLTEYGLSRWDPMRTSPFFYKDDFNKTLLSHGHEREGPLFFGNSAVAGAFVEEQSAVPLVEMGLSYGKLTDLKAIWMQKFYNPKQRLIIGIDPHLMLDKLGTDPTYPWLKKSYEPYAYFYRDYLRDVMNQSFKSLVANLSQGKIGISVDKAWDDKMHYYGRLTPEQLEGKWKDYETQFGGMSIERDMIANLEALIWVLEESTARGLPVGVVWMPVNFSAEHPAQTYWNPLRQRVNAILTSYGVPTLDLSDRYGSEDFHDLVHMERTMGAPKFTQDVSEWLIQADSTRIPVKPSL